VVCLSVAVWLCAGFLIVPAAWGQGTVVLNNRILGPGGQTTHIWGPSSTLPWLPLMGLGSNDNPSGTTPFSASAMALIGASGSGGRYGYATTRAQLLAAPGDDQPESNLVPASPATTFRTGIALGNVVSVTATLSNVPIDAPVATIQMVVWDNSSGLFPTWTEGYVAWQNSQIYAAKSAPFNVYNIGGGMNPAPPLLGLQSFNLYPGGTHEQCRIILQPQSQTVSVGGWATFSVFVNGSNPVTYQWRHNGVDIPNATTRLFKIAGVQVADAGSYSVAATTWNSGDGSSDAILTIQGAPVIVGQPQDQNVMVGQTAQFNVSVTGLPTLRYAWQFNGANLDGRTDSSLTITNAQLEQAGTYRVVVTNDCGSITSSPAKLVVATAMLLTARTAVELQFNTQTGLTYYLQASPDYSVWTNFDGPIYGNGLTWSNLYSTRGSERLFYRVWWVP
jgi:Immunoglobulin I-set domain